MHDGAGAVVKVARLGGGATTLIAENGLTVSVMREGKEGREKLSVSLSSWNNNNNAHALVARK